MKRCECGCGQPTRLAPQTQTSSGWIKGEPIRYIAGHYKRKPIAEPGPNPSGFCQCGCGGTTRLARNSDARYGDIGGRPRRFIRGHQHRGKVAPIDGYMVDPKTGCWLWLLSLDKRGYGRTKRQGKSRHAHIALYVDRYGPVPPGLELDHLCRNPACCNPDHMEAVTPTVNKRRSAATKLTGPTVAYIRRSPETNKALAELFEVHPSNISHIRAGRSWKDIAA